MWTWLCTLERLLQRQEKTPINHFCMKNIIKVILPAVYLSVTFMAEAQPDKKVVPQTDTIISNKQIQTSIQTFIRVIGSDDAKQYGLKNAAELNSLIPGKQFRRYMISINDIKNYQQGSDVKSIIKEYSAVEVSLVNSTGKIRTSIEFVNNNGQWEASRYGSTPEMVLLRSVQGAIADSLIHNGMLVRIPSLSISFIAVPSGSGLKFISLADHSNLKLLKGESVAASDAILKLKNAIEQKNPPK